MCDHYGLEPRERWVDVADPAVRVRVQEFGDGPPVVYVNGIATPGMGFAPLLGRLHPGFRSVVVDLPGHGLSPPYRWPGPPVRGQAVAVLKGVLDGLAIEKAAFVANSLGGMFVLALALDAPERLTRAVLVGDPGVALPGARGNRSMGVLDAPLVGRVAQWGLRLPSPRFFAEAVMADAIGRGAARALSKDLLDLHTLPLRLPGHARSVRSLLRRGLKGRRPRPENVLTGPEMASVTTPLLFVWGQDDVFLSPEAGRASVEAIPSARLVGMPGGHQPWMDDADLCAQLVLPGLTADPDRAPRRAMR